MTDVPELICEAGGVVGPATPGVPVRIVRSNGAEIDQPEARLVCNLDSQHDAWLDTLRVEPRYLIAQYPATGPCTETSSTPHPQSTTGQVGWDFHIEVGQYRSGVIQVVDPSENAYPKPPMH